MREYWVEVNLDEIGNIVSGGTPKTSIKEYWGGNISWITPADLSSYNNKYISKGRKSITALGLEKSSAKLMPKGSILFSSRAPIGYTAIAKCDLSTNQGFKSVTPYKGVESLFIYFYFKASKQLAVKNSSGTTFKEISKKSFSELPVPLPPLPEQRAIVAKLEELFSDLDNGIANLKKAQAQLKVYRQAVLKKAFEGELTKEWREQQTDFPKEWIKKTIKEVCENVKVGIVIKPTQYYTNDIENGIPAFRSANVREFRVNDSNWVYFSEEGNDLNKRTQLNTGDVLIVRSGYPGTSCVVPEKFQGSNAIDILIATPNQELITPEFLCTFNNSPFAKGLFSEGSRGVAQKHLNVGVYNKLSISIPSIPEQKLILKEIESRLSVCDKMEESIAESLEKAEALRQSILKKAFEGKLLTETELQACRNEPDWEPAAKLLERIKGEGNL